MMPDEKPILEDGSLSIPGEYGHPIPRELMFRELGFNGPFSRHSVGKAIVSATLKTKAVHTMSMKLLGKKNFKLPSGARTTFHLAFSPDGTKVASCHGDHNVYVSDITTMKVEQTLAGHPRTPWCVIFHPTQNDILASGCLAGHVRVWDLNGGSELLVTDSGTVIASLSFHPTVRLLAIATFNEIIFWDWARGPYPLARTSTGNVKEKVRLIRFDRLGHNIITGITNFPNPPVGGTLDSGDAETETGHPTIPARSRSAFFRPNILSRTPHPTHATQTGPRPFTASSFGMEDEVPLATMHSASASLSMTDALTERQERFQESYRQLVHHYEGLVQHYQQFIRTRLAVPDNPPVPATLIEYFQASDSEDTSMDASNDAPPIDIVISENPSHDLPSQDLINQGLNPIAANEVPGPSARFYQPAASGIGLSQRSEENTAEPSIHTTPVINPTGRPGNNNDLRSIQTLEQNILQMQNLCMQARRDSTHFPVEPVHIQELRTIRRHLEVLQDQTRRLQTSIRHTLSSLAHGTGGLEVLRGRLSSLIPSASVGVGHTAPTSVHSQLGATPASPVLEFPPSPHLTGGEEPSPVNTVEDIIGRTIQNALGGARRTFQTSGRVQSADYNAIPSTSTAANRNPQASAPQERDGTPAGHSRHTAAASRFARELLTESAHEHSRFCPYGEGGLGRPNARLRCVTDLGQSPILSVWPTFDTGHERNVRSFRLCRNDVRNGNGSSFVIPTTSTDRNTSGAAESGFPSFGSWMGEGPGWINNDLGVRVYLTVRQFNERISSLRNERDQLLAERDDLLARRARATTQLARAQRAARTREEDGPENWQRNFNSGVALVPTNVREGSRSSGRSVNSLRATGTSSAETTTLTSDESSRPRTAASTVTSEAAISNQRVERRESSTRRLPHRLDGNFQRISSMRLGDELVPVYGHLRDREVPQQNLFVFPIGLFLEGSGWPSSSIGIYWPHGSREEEESMMEYRRSENPIPVFTGRAERLLDERFARFRLDYDSTRLVLEVAEGLSLTFIQPGLPLLDAITTMGNFHRPRDNSGRVYISYITPFLDAMQRVFGSRRRREVPGNGGNSNASIGAAATVRLSTVLQPGPYSGSRGVQYSLRARRVGDENETNTASPSRSVQTEEGNSRDVPESPINQHQVNVRLRRDLLRDWERSVSVYRSGSQTSAAPPPYGRSTTNPRNQGETRNLEDIQLQRLSDWQALQQEARRDESENRQLHEAAMSMSQSAQMELNAGTDSASLASTRRVIRLAVATAASSVLRRPHVLASYAAPSMNSYDTNASRAVESRIERVLNERGNRGDMESSIVPELLQTEEMESIDPANAETAYAPWATPRPQINTMSAAAVELGSERPSPSERPGNTNPFLVIPPHRPPGIEDRGSYFLRLRHVHSTGEDVRGVVTSARPLRRTFAEMAGGGAGLESGDSDSVSDEEDDSGPIYRRIQIRRAESATDTAPPTFRRRHLRSPDPRVRFRFDSDAVGSTLRRLREAAVGSNGDRPGRLPDEPIGRSGSPAPEATADFAGGRRSVGGNSFPPAFFIRREPRDPPPPASHSGEPTRHVYYRRRIGGREYGASLPIHPQEEIPVGARFYPGYIPEIVITPRARPPNYYTLDASTTAFLSSRIQKWDFSSFEIPKLESRDKGVVVRECSLHSDACLDLSNDGDFLAVCIPSDSGSYSAVGIYSVRDESLGDIIHMFHFDQNTVSVSISPSSDYLVVGYAGRGGPFYRFVQNSRAIGQILSLTRDGDGSAKLVSVKELATDNPSTNMSVNCMHWVPVSGYGIIYGTNTGELVLLS